MNTASDQRLYQVALTLLPNIGAVLAKNLIAYCGSAEKVFKTSKSKLERIPLIGPDRAESIVKANVMAEAEAEMKFIEEYKIQTLFFTDKDYPQRLKECGDAPMLLFYRGNADLNAEKVVGIVGTRRATEYGRELTEKLVEKLSSLNVLIVSGLAYGIDIVAHQASLEHNLKTVGVLGHGMNTIYPSQHTSVAKKMIAQGGLLTEYKSTDEMSPHKFPARNRIIAGMSDAVVVVESKLGGGALLTANIANSYNRDVFTFPGRTTDRMSEGCNFLVKSYKAALIENGDDLVKAMLWENPPDGKKAKPQRQLNLSLSEDEQKLFALLNEKGEVEIDHIASETGLASSSLAAILLEMEMNNIITSLPGKRYKLI